MNLPLIECVLLFQVINVDLTHIENRIGDIIKSEKHVQLVLGQLIDMSKYNNWEYFFVFLFL